MEKTELAAILTSHRLWRLGSAEGSRADLYRADLSGANLSGADLSGANLSGAYLSGAYLSGANGDKSVLVGQRPIIQVGPIGSRAAYLVAFLTNSGIMVRAGCWFGTLDSFQERVRSVHGNGQHGIEYEAAIVLIRAHAELWAERRGQ